jgi:hypothetical protein
VKGTISFHPVDVAFFDEIIAPLVSGGKIDPDRFAAEAIAVRKVHWQVRRYARAIERIRAAAEPPGVEAGANLWERTKAYLERFDWKPDELTQRVVRSVDPDLHLEGRPFFIAEVSAAKVVETVDRYRGAPSPRVADAIAQEQLARLDPEIARALVPEEGDDLSADLVYRSDVLAALTRIHELAGAARAGRVWGRGDAAGTPAREVLRAELPWRALHLHARVVPFWTARDVDGLETICRAAKVPVPEMLVPAWRLFGAACEEFAELQASLHLEVREARDVGAFVGPDEVPKLLDFLNLHGARIIQAAAREGEGPACTTLLRKIRECAAYAEKHGLGYVEASGVMPPDLAEASPDSG